MLSFFLTFFRLIKAIVRSWNVPNFKATLFLCLVILLTGTIFFSTVEGWNWIDSLYHSAMLTSTVGSSNLSPQTNVGKLFTVLYIFVGVGVFIALFTEFAKALINDKTLSSKKSKK